MPMKSYKPEQIVTMLWKIEMEIANGKIQTYYRWKKEYGGLKLNGNN